MSDATLSMQAAICSCLSAAGFHRMAYVEFLPANTSAAPPVVCAHGLTRNGRDFDRLAAALSPCAGSSAPMWWGAGKRVAAAMPPAMAIPNTAPI